MNIDENLFVKIGIKCDHKIEIFYLIQFICLFVLLLNVPINSYGHGETVSLPDHTFFLGKLEQVVNQYFVHILLFVTENNPS